MHLSRERTLFVCYHFFSQLRKRYGRKLILTDGARWYNDACRWLRMPHQVYGTERKNLMERFIQHIKDRTECFDDHFPCRKPDCDRQHVWNWLRLFLLYVYIQGWTGDGLWCSYLWMVAKLTEPRKTEWHYYRLTVEHLLFYYEIASLLSWSSTGLKLGHACSGFVKFVHPSYLRLQNLETRSVNKLCSVCVIA